MTIGEINKKIKECVSLGNYGDALYWARKRENALKRKFSD